MSILNEKFFKELTERINREAARRFIEENERYMKVIRMLKAKKPIVGSNRTKQLP